MKANKINYVRVTADSDGYDGVISYFDRYGKHRLCILDKITDKNQIAIFHKAQAELVDGGNPGWLALSCTLIFFDAGG